MYNTHIGTATKDITIIAVIKGLFYIYSCSFNLLKLFFLMYLLTYEKQARIFP